MREDGPQCDPLPNVRRDLSIYTTGVEGREDIDWLLDDIAKDGDGPPSGGKPRLIRREGFASRISKNARPHDPGGGGTIRYPVSQNAMMNLRKSPMDMNTNRYEKLRQVPSQVAERADSDDATIKLKCMRTLLINRNRPNIRGRLWRPRRPEPTVLRMYSVGGSIVII